VVIRCWTDALVVPARSKLLRGLVERTHLAVEVGQVVGIRVGRRQVRSKDLGVVLPLGRGRRLWLFRSGFGLLKSSGVAGEVRHEGVALKDLRAPAAGGLLNLVIVRDHHQLLGMRMLSAEL